MRCPIKLNRNNFPQWFLRLVPNADDPRSLINMSAETKVFSRFVSPIKIGTTYKSTEPERHKLADRAILNVAKNLQTCPVVLDLGISDGTTSLELIEKLGNRFNKYFATDIYLSLPYLEHKGDGVFYHPQNHECIMRVSDRFIIYKATEKSISPIKALANHFIMTSPPYDIEKVQSLHLIHPQLRRLALEDNRIVLTEHDIMLEWQFDNPDIIKVANVLNLSYFSKEQIARAIANLKSSLKIGGHLFIVENRDIEKVSHFTKDKSGFCLNETINGGSEITDLVQ